MLQKFGRDLNPGLDEKSDSLLHPAIVFTIIIAKNTRAPTLW